jgi:hypothetical protein
MLTNHATRPPLRHPEPQLQHRCGLAATVRG